MSEIELLGPWDHELTDSDRRILWCNRAIGYYGSSASHGEKAAIEGLDALWKAANIIYSCDYEQRAMLCEALRQTLMHEDKVKHKDDGYDSYTRIEFLRWEGELQMKDARSIREAQGIVWKKQKEMEE